METSKDIGKKTESLESTDVSMTGDGTTATILNSSKIAVVLSMNSGNLKEKVMIKIGPNPNHVQYLFLLAVLLI